MNTPAKAGPVMGALRGAAMKGKRPLFGKKPLPMKKKAALPTGDGIDALTKRTAAVEEEHGDSPI